MDLYNADTGQLICHSEPTRGRGSDDIYDEYGFLAIPPCLWGNAVDGLTEPELLALDTTLLSIKRNNSTLGHTGEMASWQMRAIAVPKMQQETVSTNTVDLNVSPGMVSSMASDRRGQLRNMHS